MTLDEFAEIANLRLAKMYFPAKSDEESLKMLREHTEKLLRSTVSPEIDERKNCFDRHAGYETLVVGWDLGDPSGDVCVEWPGCQ